MSPEELRTQTHDEKNCLKFGSLKKKREIEVFFFSTSVLVLTLK